MLERHEIEVSNEIFSDANERPTQFLRGEENKIATTTNEQPKIEGRFNFVVVDWLGHVRSEGVTT